MRRGVRLSQPVLMSQHARKGLHEEAVPRTGTVAYMAPEVLQKGAMAMPADVYSFAMLMLELWTGEIVYSGINSHQVGSLPGSLNL